MSFPFNRPASFLGSARFAQPQVATVPGSASAGSNPSGGQPSRDGRIATDPPRSQHSHSDDSTDSDPKRILNDAFDTVQSLREHSSEFRKLLKNLDSILNAKDNEDNKVQMELDEIRPELLALRDVSRKLKDENGQVLSELDEAKSEVEELINMNEDLERARLEALDDVSMMEIKRGRLWLMMDNEICSTVALKEVEVSTIEAKFERAQQGWNSTETKYRDDLVELNSRNNAILEKFQCLEREISQMCKLREESISATKTFLEEQHSSAIDSISKKLLAYENINSELRGKLVDAESKMGNIKQEYKAEVLQKDEQIFKMESDLKLAEDNAIGLDKQFQDVSHEKDQLKEELRNQKKEIGGMKSRYEYIESELNSFRTENSKLVTQVEAEQARVKVALTVLQNSLLMVKNINSTMEVLGNATNDYFTEEAKLLQIPRNLSTVVESKLQGIRGSLSCSANTIENLTNQLRSKNEEIIRSNGIAHKCVMAKKVVDASLAESEEKLKEATKQLGAVKENLKASVEKWKEGEEENEMLRLKLEEEEKEKEKLMESLKEIRKKRKKEGEEISEGSAASKGRARKKQKVALIAPKNERGKKAAKRRSPRVTACSERAQPEVEVADEESPASSEVEIVETEEAKAESPGRKSSTDGDEHDIFNDDTF